MGIVIFIIVFASSAIIDCIAFTRSNFPHKWWAFLPYGGIVAYFVDRKS